MFAVAGFDGERSKSDGTGEISIDAGGGGEVLPLQESKRIRPWIVEPADIATTSPMTSPSATTTGSAPNSPSVQPFFRPRSARTTYCPGVTFGNSNAPLSATRAPAGA